MTAAPSSRPTMKDVAAIAGVSPKTVSNVVTGSVVVREETRVRVEAAMAELDFVPNLSARGLRNGRSGMIAVALPFLDTAFSAALLHHIVEAAHRRHLAVQIQETGAEPDRERELLSRARAHLVDGLILNPIRLEDSVVTQAEGLPVVLIGEVEKNDSDHVGIDSVAGAAEITRHLIAQGARRIAVIGSDGEDAVASATRRARLQGVHDALLEAGITPDPHLEMHPAEWSMSGGADATEQLIARGRPFDAVVAFTDSLAAGVLHALRAHGIRVPEDVLVTGFDNVEISEFTAPPLSTVEIDVRAFAESAVGLLVARMTDRRGAAQSITVPHRLVLRGSTSARPAGHPQAL